MTKIVAEGRPRSGLADACDRLGCNGTGEVRRGDEDVAVFVVAAGGHPVFELVASVQPQLCDGAGVKVDGVAAGGRLGAAFEELVFPAAATA